MWSTQPLSNVFIENKVPFEGLYNKREITNLITYFDNYRDNAACEIIFKLLQALKEFRNGIEAQFSTEGKKYATEASFRNMLDEMAEALNTAKTASSKYSPDDIKNNALLTSAYDYTLTSIIKGINELDHTESLYKKCWPDSGLQQLLTHMQLVNKIT